MPRAGRRSPARGGLAGAGIAALAVVCCAALPALAAVAGSIAVGIQIGAAGAILAAFAGAAVLAVRVRRRRSGGGEVESIGGSP